MNRKRLILILLALSLSIPPLFIGCEGLPEAGTAIGQAVGVIDDEEADSIIRVGTAARNASERLTAEQEYYVGRAVAAKVFQSYKPLDLPEANAYLNVLGQSLVVFSDRPETFGGYHFMLLDSDEINAFAAPDGLILVTRGMVQCCGSEDELAAVLAHEISHVVEKHGVSAIQGSRLTTLGTTVLTEAGKHAGGELSDLVEDFEGSIGDITKTLMNGYSRDQERDADAGAVTILRRAGYPETALVTMLQRMEQHLGTTGGGFGDTHPKPESRIASVRSELSGASVAASPARQQRFAKAMQTVAAVN
jgi:beta-barrel assembly-enhancing protease